MTEIDTRIAAYLIWGVGTVICYGLVLVRVVRRHSRNKSQRHLGELLVSLGLFLTSLAAFLAITLALWAPQNGMRSTLSAVALGAFFAVGLVMAQDRRAR